MKKLFLVVAVLAVTGISQTYAQEVKFGAKAGVNFAKLTGDSDHDEIRTGFHVGAVAEIMLSDVFSVQPELLFSAQGTDYSNSEFLEAVYDGAYKLNYINLPIMAKFYVTEGLSLEAGPQVGFLLSAKEDWEDVDSGASDDDVDVKDSFKGIDFGLNFGLGYKLENGLNFAARYNLGLSDLNDDEEVFGSDSYKNAVIQLSVGFFF